MVQKRLCLFQIGRIKAFGEPAVDRGQGSRASARQPWSQRIESQDCIQHRNRRGVRSSFQAVPYMISGTAALRRSKVLAVRMGASILRVRLVSKKNWVSSPQSAASAAIARAKGQSNRVSRHRFAAAHNLSCRREMDSNPRWTRRCCYSSFVVVFERVVVPPSGSVNVFVCVSLLPVMPSR